MAIHRKEGITGQKKHWTRALDGGDKNGVHAKGKNYLWKFISSLWGFSGTVEH